MGRQHASKLVLGLVTLMAIAVSYAAVSSHVSNAQAASTEMDFWTYFPLVVRRWPPIPDPPQIWSISNDDLDGTYTVAWAPAAPAQWQEYALEEDTDPSFAHPQRLYVGSALHFAISGKQPGIYYYRVSAGNQYGWSGWSQVVNTIVTKLFQGRVTYSGAPYANLKVNLRQVEGNDYATVMTTTTSADGRYQFNNVPALARGQQYYVRYWKETNKLDERFLWSFVCNRVSQYPTVDDLTCDFDIVNMTHRNPPHGALVSLPVEFSWFMRDAVPDEGYRFNIWRDADLDWYSGDLGRASIFRMQQLPPGFVPNQRYWWQPQALYRFGVGYPYWTWSVRFDHFFDDFSNPESGWGEADTEDVRWDYINGEYRILPKATGRAGWEDSPGGRAENYVVEVDARAVSDPPGCYGLIFGYEWGSHYDYYLFWVDPKERQYMLVKRIGDLSVRLLNWTRSDKIRTAGAINHLRVVRRGDRIELHINGSKLTELRDGDYMGFTGVGVSGWACWSGPADLRFDNFRQQALSSSALGFSPLTIEPDDSLGLPTDSGEDAPMRVGPIWDDAQARSENPATRSNDW